MSELLQFIIVAAFGAPRLIISSRQWLRVTMKAVR